MILPADIRLSEEGLDAEWPKIADYSSWGRRILGRTTCALSISKARMQAFLSPKFGPRDAVKS